MDSRPQRPAPAFNLIIGTGFALAGVGALISGVPTVSGAMFCVGAAFLVYGTETRPWADLPRWKRLLLLGLIFAGAVFLVIALISAFGG